MISVVLERLVNVIHWRGAEVKVNMHYDFKNV